MKAQPGTVAQWERILDRWVRWWVVGAREGLVW